jgi:hypothetical protein
VLCQTTAGFHRTLLQAGHRHAEKNHRATRAGRITRAVLACRTDESRRLDGKPVSENRPGRGGIAVLHHPKWRNSRLRPQTVARAGEKRSKPCGTSLVCIMGVLKQKVIMVIPIE